nr:hypothetical protein [Anaerolineae bacterium]
MSPDQSTVAVPVPVELEIRILPDGSVIFADLAADIRPVVERLDPSACTPASGVKTFLAGRGTAETSVSP